MLFYKVYWTHLHKCFTAGSKKPLKFQPENAEQCAKGWLEEEFSHVISNKTRFIIALGNIVKRTLEKQNISNKYRELIIKLPHPSGRNRKWNDKEWYVVFTADVIRKIVYKFMKNGLTKAVNEMHETPVDDVFIFESWIVDDVKGVPEGFQDVPQGSWFGSMRVENDEIWKKIKEDDGYMLKGFSVEGIFREDKEMTMDQEVIEAVIDAIQK